MPTIEVNKIIASVLTALIVMMVGTLLADQIIRPKAPEKPVFVAAATAPAASAPAAQPAAASLAPIGPLLAKADTAKGQGLTKICQVCHSFDKGGPNKLGPNLWDVVGQPIAEDRGGFALCSGTFPQKQSEIELERRPLQGPGQPPRYDRAFPSDPSRTKDRKRLLESACFALGTIDL